MRRITDRQNISGSNYLDDPEIALYIKDAAQDIRVLYPAFTSFTVTGTSISPTPDAIDESLLRIGASALILMDDDIEASGGAISIKTGPISLDTSKSLKAFSAATKRMLDRLERFIEALLIYGKAGELAGYGTSVDIYKELISDGQRVDPDAP